MCMRNDNHSEVDDFAMLIVQGDMSHIIPYVRFTLPYITNNCAIAAIYSTFCLSSKSIYELENAAKS